MPKTFLHLEFSSDSLATLEEDEREGAMILDSLVNHWLSLKRGRRGEERTDLP